MRKLEENIYDAIQEKNGKCYKQTSHLKMRVLTIQTNAHGKKVRMNDEA